jgi:hypothetical protein
MTSWFVLIHRRSQVLQRRILHHLPRRPLLRRRADGLDPRSSRRENGREGASVLRRVDTLHSRVSAPLLFRRESSF